ncbi:MAG: hypothetical protein ABIA37_01915 [Candidatus Woesearchaeota archaeon]
MKEKNLVIINITLVLTAVIFTLHLLDVTLPSLGQAQYLLDREEPVCIFSFEDQQTVFNDPNLCCFEMQKQLHCENYQNQLAVGGNKYNLEKRCTTGSGSLEVLANSKTYNYCKKEEYYLR